jgi:tol-pal system protein YbgF
MKIIRCIILCVLLVESAYAVSNSNEPLLDKIDRLENQILLLEKKIEDLKYAQAQTSSAANNASLHSRLLAVEEKMRELNGKFEYSDHTFQQILERIRNLSADVDYRFRQLEQKHNTQPITSPIPTSGLEPNISQETSPLVQYQELINKAQYSQAINGLEKYITNNKNSTYAGEAYYLLGTAYTKQKLYDKAAINYLKGYKNYPTNHKAADSLLDLANALTKLNKKDKACNILDKLEKEYPNRSSVNKQQTIEMVGKLGCK